MELLFTPPPPRPEIECGSESAGTHAHIRNQEKVVSGGSLTDTASLL